MSLFYERITHMYSGLRLLSQQLLVNIVVFVICYIYVDDVDEVKDMGVGCHNGSMCLRV